MKKHQILVVILLAGIAAYFLNEGRKLRGNESIASEELNMLREAVKKSPGAASAAKLAGKNNLPPAIDAKKFIVELSDFLKAAPSTEKGKGLGEFMSAYEPQLRSTPLAKLKEICDLLEKSFPFDQPDSEVAQFVWFGVVRLAAKSDPAWAFAKFDQVVSTTKIPIEMQLSIIKNSQETEENPMSRAYATAMQQWLDTAQAAGRIEATDPLVAGLRAEIAAAHGDQSSAVKQISELPSQSQRKAAIDYLKGLPTPEAQRKGMEELSIALDFYGFTAAVHSLADQQGFDAARGILSSASLTPEKHDLAAAAIASADIGSDTPAKAKWLLESIRGEDARAITGFADRWTHADYQGAAQWLNSLSAGKQRDAAISGFAPIAAKIDGASALDWALTVSDPAQRDSCLGDVVRNWKEMDAAAATAYMKEKGLIVK